MNIADFIPEQEKIKKKPESRYKKPDSIKQFEAQYKVFHYSTKNIPDNLQTDFKFSDKTANGLTKLILAYFKMKGGFAGRVNTQGNYSEKLGKFIKSGAKRGMADITAVINGKHISVEVKIGKDKPRESQIEVKREIEQAGGVYMFVNSYDSFLMQINAI